MSPPIVMIMVDMLMSTYGMYRIGTCNGDRDNKGEWNDKEASTLFKMPLLICIFFYTEQGDIDILAEKSFVFVTHLSAVI